jgi:hypothetical protein
MAAERAMASSTIHLRYSRQPARAFTGLGAGTCIEQAQGSPEVDESVKFMHDKTSGRRWALICLLNFFPLAAFLHNGVFYRPTCMLNPFGADYAIPTWLARDPSVPWAIVSSMLIYKAGFGSQMVRTLATPIFVAFLPLTIWIWDIPFTSRVICLTFHDARLVLFGTTIMSRHFYALGLFLYFALLALGFTLKATTRANAICTLEVA